MKKLLPFLIAALLISGCGSPKEQKISDTAFFFDTVVTITIYNTNDTTLLSDCFALCDYYERLFDNTDPNSEIYQINVAASAPLSVSQDTEALLTIGKQYYVETDGRFALTVGALTKLWNLSGVDDGSFRVPTDGEIANAVDTIDDENLFVEGDSVVLIDPEARLDCGGIAKGYVADQLKTYLLGKGVSSAIINLGGNVLAVGDKPDGSAFNIGIQKPFAEEGTPIVSLQIKDRSLVTSGIYERYREKDGVLYHHLMDTKTGRPAENDLASVTIISDRSVDGDALSTAVFVMGLADGKAYVEGLNGVEAVFVTRDNAVISTSGIDAGALTVYD